MSRFRDSLRRAFGLFGLLVLALLPNKLTLEAQLSFDILGPVVDNERKSWDLQRQRYVLDWKSQCYNWQLQYRESNYRDTEEREYRFVLALRNIGTFLDLHDRF